VAAGSTVDATCGRHLRCCQRSPRQPLPNRELKGVAAHREVWHRGLEDLREHQERPADELR
jgi:hypothetical protein